jgi:uncharacterized membrane protein YqjE
VRVLWSLPQAAPALLRHLAAYVELAGYDLAQTQREVAESLVAFVIVAVSLFFAVLMGCAIVVALTWDTPHRVAAICWMAAGFVVIAIIAIVYRSSVLRAQAPMLASVRREWQEDRVILERILADE